MHIRTQSWTTSQIEVPEKEEYAHGQQLGKEGGEGGGNNRKGKEK